MNEKTRLRLLLAAAAMVAGILGEVSSLGLFGSGVSLDGTLGLQMLFVGLILSGFYIALGEIPQKEGTTQAPSIPTSENADAETAGAKESQTRPGRDSMTRVVDLMVIVVFALIVLSCVWAGYASYGLFIGFHDYFAFFVVKVIRDSSFMAGVLLAVLTAFLRMGKNQHHLRTAKACSVLLILIALSWVIVERTGYAALLGYLEHLEPSDYIALARLSTGVLLASVSISTLVLGLYVYFLRPRLRETVKPTQKPA